MPQQAEPPSTGMSAPAQTGNLRGATPAIGVNRTRGLRKPAVPAWHCPRIDSAPALPQTLEERASPAPPPCCPSASGLPLLAAEGCAGVLVRVAFFGGRHDLTFSRRPTTRAVHAWFLSHATKWQPVRGRGDSSSTAKTVWPHAPASSVSVVANTLASCDLFSV